MQVKRMAVLLFIACTGGSVAAAEQATTHDMAHMTPAEMAAMHATTEATAADDKGLVLLSNGEMSHHYGPDQPLDKATRARLAHQLALTRDTADKYPTLKDAKAAGYITVGPFFPGMGVHVAPTRGVNLIRSVNMDGVMTDEKIQNPSMIMYDGTDDDAPIAGFMYYAFSAQEPEGFAGPNDHWHYHTKLCMRPGTQGIELFGIGTIPDRAECRQAGGRWTEKSNWMVHVWTIPGYESNRGVFSDINPAIACSDGTYFQVAESETRKYTVNICRADAR